MIKMSVIMSVFKNNLILNKKHNTILVNVVFTNLFSLQE